VEKDGEQIRTVGGARTLKMKAKRKPLGDIINRGALPSRTSYGCKQCNVALCREGEEFHRILVSTPRINTLSDWSLRRGAPTKKNWGWGMGAPRLSEPIRQGVYSGGGNKYSDGVAILACF
jgi:hypothetical protein